MTLYELLRNLVNRSQWDGEALKNDAVELLNALERVQAFGTLTSALDEQNHDHTPEMQYFFWAEFPSQTDYYGRAKPNARQGRCKICNRSVGPVEPLFLGPLPN